MRRVAPSGAAHVARRRCRAVGNDLPGLVRDEEVRAREDRLGEPAYLQRQSAQDLTCRCVEQIDGGLLSRYLYTSWTVTFPRN